MDDVRIYTGTVIADLVLHAAGSLKEMRAPLRALVQKLRNEDFAVARVGPVDRAQRAFVAVSAVSGDPSLLDERLDLVERMLFDSPFEVGDLRRESGVVTFPAG